MENETTLFFILFAQSVSLVFLRLIRPLFGTHPALLAPSALKLKYVDTLRSAGERFLTQTIFANNIIMIGLGILFLYVGIILFEKFGDI